MTIYVYKLRGLNPFGPKGTYMVPWFGLTADTEEELHPFAERLGLYRHFYRPPAPAGPQHVPGVGHYDLDQGERDRAVAGGAQAVRIRKLDKSRKP